MSRARRKQQAGFTLVELMVAMMAGLATVAGAYYLGSSSQHAFSEQMNSTEAQTALRSAFEQLERDIQRAGFLATADSALLADCSGATGPGSDVAPTAPNQELWGVQIASDTSIADAEVKALLGAGGRNLTRADTLTLAGNYDAGEFYKVTSQANSSTDTVVLDQVRESFRRSFVTAATTLSPGGFSPARFSAAFPQNRLLRIDTGGHTFFRTIVNANTADASVQFSPPIPSACFQPSTALVTPVSLIRYSVEPLTNNPDFQRVAYDPGKPGTERVALVRAELDSTNTAVTMPNSARMVLDYAVEFQVNAVINTAAAGLPPAWSIISTGSSGATTVDLANQAFPGGFRSLIVTLSARTDEVDKRFSPLPMRTTLDQPLKSFAVQVASNVTWYARVRSLRREILLPNMNP